MRAIRWTQATADANNEKHKKAKKKVPAAGPMTLALERYKTTTAAAYARYLGIEGPAWGLFVQADEAARLTFRREERENRGH